MAQCRPRKLAGGSSRNVDKCMDDGFRCLQGIQKIPGSEPVPSQLMTPEV